ncbi:hypothetical protein [Stenotrophomonas ginsengisoli]
MMNRVVRCLLPLLMLAGCTVPDKHTDTAGDAGLGAQAADGEHMVSINSADAPPLPPRPQTDQWPDVDLEGNRIFVSCDVDYAGGGDGQALEALSRPDIEQVLSACQERGLLRVRYQGKITGVFVEAMWRITQVADALAISRRVLDLDSSGGQVEAAIRVGDQIGASGWTIWVREGSVCHSACVFVLAAGDNRLLAGKVGIHRMMRISSKATSRAELNDELQQVYGKVKDYLQRNGVAVGVADLMMTVPNRSLRLLTSEELRQYGLDGTNAVQDDLERIRQMRKCGADFVRRKDAFLVSFDQRCKNGRNDLEALTSCGQGLKERFGFPDATCPDESPLAEIDNGHGELVPPAATPEPEAEGGDEARTADADAAPAAPQAGTAAAEPAADKGKDKAASGARRQ